MSDTFSTPDLNAEILNWIAVAKGDLPGHEFHGNQYSDGGARAAKELRQETEGFRAGMNKHEMYPGGDNHREFAEAHDRLAQSALTPELRQGHKEAADAHREAAKLQDIAEERKGYGDTTERADKASYDALSESNFVLKPSPTPPAPVDPNQPL